MTVRLLPRRAWLGLALLALPACQTWTPQEGMTIPSGRYLEQPPQYIPATPAFPLPRELASQEPATVRGVAPPTVPLAPLSPGGATAVPASLPPAAGPPLKPSLPSAGSAPPASVDTSAAKPGPASAEVRLTVANVTREEALLFSGKGDETKLTFVQKLPPGEAVDVKAQAGQLWVAVLTGRPAAEKYTAQGTGGTWLLRPTPR
jgi:hypothetical protein